MRCKNDNIINIYSTNLICDLKYEKLITTALIVYQSIAFRYGTITVHVNSPCEKFNS